MMINNDYDCFVSTLARLKESSKDAVVSADSKSIDEYTMYMHVNRPVQDKFVSILQGTYNTDHAELILLCGSVGDGKSHMLSYCKSKYPDMMGKFYVHNDSTASLYVDKPASYTLKEIMEDFTDEKIECSNKKVILAINLGTLSNFLEEDTDNRFAKLKKYVEDIGILDEQVGKDNDDKFFHSVNFADYHIYELSEQGAGSSYIQGILEKITLKEDKNVFYASYCENCKTCHAYEDCPVRTNYELLSAPIMQKGIIEALIENIVKNKLIVSTRALLNMIYEILVDERAWERGSLGPRKEPEKMTSIAYCEALLPNVLFGKKNALGVLGSMYTIDPMRIRNECIDDFFVYYENTNDIEEIFEEHLKGYFSLPTRLQNMDFSTEPMHSVKESVLRLFVRTCWLTKQKQDLLPEDRDYIAYMKALYFWNKGICKKLKTIYGDVGKGVLLWNGRADMDEMQLLPGNKKVGYHLVQKIHISPVFNNLPSYDNEILCSFRDELKLRYKDSNNNVAELDLDFVLYILLKKVLKGYVPSMNDKRVNMKCVEFVNKISQGGSKMSQLYIRELSQKAPQDYMISYDEDLGYSFEVN